MLRSTIDRQRHVGRICSKASEGSLLVYVKWKLPEQSNTLYAARRLNADPMMTLKWVASLLTERSCCVAHSEASAMLGWQARRNVRLGKPEASNRRVGDSTLVSL